MPRSAAMSVSRTCRSGRKAGGTGSSALSQKLKEIFEFENEEEVIEGMRINSGVVLRINLPSSEYPCWLLQSVLLQGYLYITAKHICFYAYLPKKSVSMSNKLTK